MWGNRIRNRALGSREVLRAVSVGVRHSRRWILRRADFGVERGAVLAVIGPNGSGKTTLLNALLGVISPAEGHVFRLPGRDVGMVPQHVHISSVMPLTVQRLMAVGRRFVPVERRKAEADRFGLTPLWNSQLSALSGGERQRAMIARSLCSDPELLVLDEPSLALDGLGQDILTERIDELKTTVGSGVIIVSHDEVHVRGWADSLLTLTPTSGNDGSAVCLTPCGAAQGIPCHGSGQRSERGEGGFDE